MSGIIDVWTQFISPTPPGREPAGRERLPQLRHARRLPPRHRRREDDRRHGPPRRAGGAHGRRQRGRREGAEPAPGPHLRPVPRRADAHHEGGARARPLRAQLRLRLPAHRAVHVAEAADRPRLLSALRQGGRARRHVPDAGRPHRAALPVRDRPADLHRRGGARLPRAAHRVRPHRLAVDGGDDRASRGSTATCGSTPRRTCRSTTRRRSSTS